MIKAQRLLLRRARLEDAAAMHVILSNEAAMRYWSTPPHTRLDQTLAWMADMVAGSAEGNEDYLIEIDGQVVGKVGAYRLPEFGYILHPDHWGQGLATEALGGYLRHIYENRPDIALLNADIDPRNVGSVRLVERLGFQETGRAQRTYHTHIGWCDSVYFTIDRPAMAKLALNQD